MSSVISLILVQNKCFHIFLSCHSPQLLPDCICSPTFPDSIVHKNVGDLFCTSTALKPMLLSSQIEISHGAIILTPNHQQVAR